MIRQSLNWEEKPVEELGQQFRWDRLETVAADVKFLQPGLNIHPGEQNGNLGNIFENLKKYLRQHPPVLR